MGKKHFAEDGDICSCGGVYYYPEDLDCDCVTSGACEIHTEDKVVCDQCGDRAEVMKYCGHCGEYLLARGECSNPSCPNVIEEPSDYDLL